MSSSVILVNCFFVSLAILVCISLFKNLNLITCSKGMPFFIIVALIGLRALTPWEFAFTKTLKSEKILTITKSIERADFSGSYTWGRLFLIIWIVGSLGLAIITIVKTYKLHKMISLVPDAENFRIARVLHERYDGDLKQRPRVIQLEGSINPFIIMGWKNPTIVLPKSLSDEEIYFVMIHELEHFIHYHLRMKVFIDLLFIIYWWNPVIWLLRSESTQALELQADTYVLNNLDHQEILMYAKTMIKLASMEAIQKNPACCLSFSSKKQNVKTRILKVLSYNVDGSSKTTDKFSICGYVLAIILLLAPLFYTFEAAYSCQEVEGGSFAIDKKTDYFLLNQEGQYDLMVQGRYKITFEQIPHDLEELPIK